ncbi:MAG: PAS domain S-box protein [Ignavibacteriae bacterium]|nr:PAS domain S-box protein [Ignavibacteriota bacterium]NOG99888.1 PAS domain S-box protein [Ignavibacteriota bacterium]
MLDEIFQNIPFPIYIYDADNLKLLEVNDTAAKLYGYSREDFLQMDITELYSPEDIQTLLVLPNDELKKGVFTGPWRQMKQSGETILVEVNRTVISFRNTKAILNVIKEVSGEYQIHRKMQIYKASWEYASDIMIYTDREGFIKNANKHFSKVLGFAELERNLSFLNFIADDERQKISEEIFKPGKKQTVEIESSLKDIDSKLIKSKIISAPIQNYDGEVFGYNLVIKPIPAEVKSKVEKIEKDDSSEFGPAFLSSLFHEILTPLNVIIGFNHELIDSIENPSEEQAESIELIKQNQNSLLEVMNTSAEYVSLLQGNIQLKPQNIAFVDLLNEIEKNTEQTSKIQNVELTYGKISSSLIIEVDPQKLITLLSIFLRFALKIAREKSSIYISAYIWDADNFVIGLKDNRQQITQQFLENIRSIFTSEEALLQQKFDLSKFEVKVLKELTKILSASFQEIVREGVVVEFGLKIPRKFDADKIDETASLADSESHISDLAESQEQPAEVAEEEITIDEEYTIEAETNTEPQTVVSTQAAIESEVNAKVSSITEADSASENTAVIETAKPEPDLSCLSCLYVEDQVDSQILFRVQMKDLKSIEFADSLEKALPLLKRQKFDFVILDINLKGEYNGLDALRVIQQMPAYQDVPIIAVTAYALSGDKDKFLNAGFNGFIAKPLMRDKLTATLSSILN